MSDKTLELVIEERKRILEDFERLALLQTNGGYLRPEQLKLYIELVKVLLQNAPTKADDDADARWEEFRKRHNIKWK